ncbi:uncharacterized protein LOC117123992 [Anneissia japonica]|uniref:uncharacterized protein LOC117123992 n=1 Tax=Anneissia japonica TaxID=1529436 RepID=UPI001425AE56|nr:uncharacterized protein LOC117123992 [Anneissia japonica]XP_033125985.1 uncharacterized protein LOC117123992 [Anneissia japonica]
MADRNKMLVLYVPPCPQTKAKKKAVPKKPASQETKAKKKPACHPPYFEMISAAIGALKQRDGSSRQAISKYIQANYTVDAASMNTQLKMALKRGIGSGNLIQAKGTGACGSFKLNLAKAEEDAVVKKEEAKIKAATNKLKKAAMKSKAYSRFGNVGHSESDLHRQLGNIIYRTVTRCIGPVLTKRRLEKARKHYTDALECSASPREAAAANKNLAMASWKLTSVVEGDQKTRCVLAMQLYKEALRCFSKAWKRGQDAGNGNLWSDSVVQKMHQCLQKSLDFVTNQPNMWDEKNQLMVLACRLLPTRACKAEVSVLHAEFLLSKAIKLLQNGVFGKAKTILYDCHQPLEEARRYGGSDRGVMSEVNVLHEDVVMQTFVAEARQALETADNLQQKILMSEEDLNIDMVWEVLDWYKKAILLTREKDVELEAIAMSRMGVIYDSILKLRSKARPYFKGAITLAHSLHPRVLTYEEWYQTCAQTLESYQMKTVLQETRAWMKEREDALKKLEPQIRKFQYIEDNYECLQYIYKNHPPKKEHHKLPDNLPEPSKIEQTQLKKCLQKAIVHYHPDHNSKEKFGKEWHVLCEEITKVFTKKYNCMKGVDV